MDDLISIIRLLEEAPGSMGAADNAAAPDGLIKVLLIERGPNMIVGNLIVPEAQHRQVFCVQCTASPQRPEELPAAGYMSPAHCDCVETHLCVVYRPFGIDTVCVRLWPLQAHDANSSAA